MNLADEYSNAISSTYIDNMFNEWKNDQKIVDEKMRSYQKTGYI